MVDGVNGKGNNLEVLFGGLSGNEAAKQASDQRSSQAVAALDKVADSAAVRISVGEDKTERVVALKAVYEAGGGKALDKLYNPESVAKALLG